VRRRAAAAAAGLAALAAALPACGVESPDLFVLTRSGDVPGARLHLLVNDGGTVRCNGGHKRTLPDPLLLQARDLQEQITEDARAHKRYPPGRGGVFAYSIRDEDGTVAWADTSRPLPERYLRLAFLARQIARGPCGLSR
jgi:hypothetical protein